MQDRRYRRYRLICRCLPVIPDRYRINGPLRNLNGWYEAFDVKPGDKFYLPPEQRVRIW